MIQSGEPYRFEDERQGVWFDNIFYPIYDAQGKVTKVAILARDITERKRAEDPLAQRVQELELFNRLAVGRELRMIELKRQINELSEQLGKELPYNLSLLGEERAGKHGT